MARITTRWLLRGGIAELGLSAVEGLVLCALLDHVNASGITWVPQKHLSRDLKIARSTVQLALARMVDLGVLVEHERGTHGRAARYRIGTPQTVEDARLSGTFVA